MSNVHMKKPSASSDIRIAGSRTSRDWALLKAALVPGCDPGLWEKAAHDYFDGRLSTRYLQSIRAIQAKPALNGEGFSVVAIQCSLIEFLESTLRGLNYSYRPRGITNPPGPYEYSDSQDLFVDFLRKRKPFNQYFTKGLAKDFYVGVRCGLLHEARTKKGWIIHSQGPSVIDARDPLRKIVYHVNFQRALEDFIRWYKAELLSNDRMKEAFIRKFDSLCD
jgi:hypothetical protein